MLKKENNRFQKREKKTEESLTKAQVGLIRLSEVIKVIELKVKEVHSNFTCSNTSIACAFCSPDLQKETALLSVIDRIKNNVLLDCMTATF